MNFKTMLMHSENLLLARLTGACCGCLSVTSDIVLSCLVSLTISTPDFSYVSCVTNRNVGQRTRYGGNYGTVTPNLSALNRCN